MFVTQDYIPVAINILLPSAGNYGSDFINGGKIVSATIFTLLQDNCHLKVLLQLGRTVMHDLVSLLIQRDQRIVGIQHVLKFAHEDMIEIWIARIASGKGGLLIINVELGIRGTATI
jgi:hypothetical protein